MHFFLIITIIYLACYAYIRFWFWRILVETPRFRRNVLIFMDISTLVLLVARFARDHFPSSLTTALQTYGYCWSAIIVCLVPFALLAEPIRFFFKKFRPDFRLCSGVMTFSVVVLMSGLMLIGGFINAMSPQIKDLELELLNKNAPQKELTIAAFSDLHAGNVVDQAWVAEIVKKVNSLSPDIILLVGDILGDKELEKNGALKELAKLRAPMGKFAVLGNHEFYLDNLWSIRLLESAGIRVLQDEAVIVQDYFVLAGRQDYTIQRIGGKRLPVKDLLSGHASLPVILMDHNPKELSEAAAAGVTFQLSGHTHNGQLFPFNFLISRIYEKAWGGFRKAGTQYYISCGVGIWGPPLRTSSRPEILRIKVHFNS